MVYPYIKGGFTEGYSEEKIKDQLETLQKILFYFEQYQSKVFLSLIYTAVLSLLGLVLILRRESLFGFTLTAFLKFGFVLGFAVYSLFHQDAHLLLNINATEGLTKKLLILDAFIFPIALVLITALVVLSGKLSQRHQNLETFYLIAFVFSMAMTILIYKFLRADNLIISKAYFTEVLYSTDSLFIHYLYFLAPLALIFAFIFKRVVTLSFDPIQACLVKVPVVKYNFVFYLLVGLSVAVSIRVLGVYLTVVCLLVPAYMSLLIGYRLMGVVLLTLISSIFFGLTGFSVSFMLDELPTEPILMITYCILSGLVVLAKRFLHLVLGRTKVK